MNHTACFQKQQEGRLFQMDVNAAVVAIQGHELSMTQIDEFQSGTPRVQARALVQNTPGLSSSL